MAQQDQVSSLAIDPQWSHILSTPNNIDKLHLLTSSRKTLSKSGYVLEPLSDEEIWRKVHCKNCGQRMKYYRPDQIVTLPKTTVTGEPVNTDPVSKPECRTNELQQIAQSQTGQRHLCLFHDGTLFSSVWQCCNGHMYSQGCCSRATHEACDLTQARAEWLYHNTPVPELPVTVRHTQNVANKAPIATSGFNRGRRGGRFINSHSEGFTGGPVSSSGSNNAKDVRVAVALDCEMGTPKSGTNYDNVLIRLSVIDFFTRETLIDSLVRPSVEMLHYNTRFSGVTFADMRIASRSGNIIQGTDAARRMLLKYVDASTFIVMHGGNNDLTALRLIHPVDRIIDTFSLEAHDYDAINQKLKRNLKDVCLRRCGIVVQNAKQTNGRKAGHNSLEDALSCREIACAWMKSIPDDS